MTTRYWVILGHSEITERNQITTLPQKTDLVLTTTCGRVFQKNNIYERMFENDNLTYVKAFDGFKVFDFIMLSPPLNDVK